MNCYVVKNKPCPCDCDGNGQLLYISCSSCNCILLMCDEIGNIFDNLMSPLNSKDHLVIWRSSKQVCPQCKEVLLSNFVPATESLLKQISTEEFNYEVAGKNVFKSFIKLLSV